MSDIYVQAAEYDAAIIVTELNFGLRGFAFRFWHDRRKRILTYFGAHILAEAAGIKITKVNYSNQFKPSSDGLTMQTITIANVWTNTGPVASTARSANPAYGQEIAKGLAFRNAVQRFFTDARLWRGEAWREA